MTTRRNLLLLSSSTALALCGPFWGEAFAARAEHSRRGAPRTLSNGDTEVDSTAFRFSQFGANPDWDETSNSGTDNTAAIQKCIDAAHQAGGGTVIGERGNYRLDSQLIIYSDISLILEDGCYLWRNWLNNDYNVKNSATLRNVGHPEMNKFVVKSGYYAWSAVDHNIHIRGPGGFKTPKQIIARAFDEKKFAGPHISFVGIENFTLQKLNCWRAGRAWLMYVVGNNWSIDGVNYFGGQEVWEDGIHIMGGKNGSISNCHIESGDDAIAFGGDLNLPISDIKVSNCTVVSNKGRAVAFFQYRAGITASFEAPTEYVERINIRGVTGRAGLHRNNLLGFYTDKRAPDRIRDIDISGLDITQGDMETHEAAISHGLIMQGGKRCRIQGSLRNCIRLVAFLQQGADEITLDITANATQADGYPLIQIVSCGTVTISGSLVCRSQEAIRATNVANLNLQNLKVANIPSGFGVARIAGQTNLYATNVSGTRAPGAHATYLFQSDNPGAAIQFQNCDSRGVDTDISPRSVQVYRN